jgi:hypothetical protein
VINSVKIINQFVKVDLIVVSKVLLLKLIAFGKARCFNAANVTKLLKYYTRLLAN